MAPRGALFPLIGPQVGPVHASLGLVVNPPRRGTRFMPGRSFWAKSVRLSLLEHLPLFGLLGLNWAAYLWVSSVYLGPNLSVTGSELYMILVVGVAAVVGVSVAYSLSWAIRRSGSRGSDVGRWLDFLGRRVTIRQVLGVFVALPWWMVFVRIFDTLKAYIPVIIPFRWDELFMRIDRALHGGVHPWRLLHDLFGGHLVTVAIDEFYYSWYLVVIVAIVWAAWSANRKRRLRFFVALATVQFGLGNVLALLGSSAGPIYYEKVVAGVPAAGGPFGELVGHLERVHASASLHMWPIQESLWAHYLALPDTGTGSIAAMPSIHVAAVVLFALATHGSHKLLSALVWGYAFFTLVGSVYLGWHYAIDGYVAAICTVLIWFGAARFTDWYWPRFVRPVEG